MFVWGLLQTPLQPVEKLSLVSVSSGQAELQEGNSKAER